MSFPYLCFFVSDKNLARMLARRSFSVGGLGLSSFAKAMKDKQADE